MQGLFHLDHDVMFVAGGGGPCDDQYAACMLTVATLPLVTFATLHPGVQVHAQLLRHSGAMYSCRRPHIPAHTFFEGMPLACSIACVCRLQTALHSLCHLKPPAFSRRVKRLSSIAHFWHHWNATGKRNCILHACAVLAAGSMQDVSGGQTLSACGSCAMQLHKDKLAHLQALAQSAAGGHIVQSFSTV